MALPTLFLPRVLFSSVAQSCPTLCDPMDCSTPGLPAITNSQSLFKLMSIESVMPSNRLILCRPLLLPPSIFPSIRVFSSESALHIRWPKYWSFSFSISPSNEHSGLTSFRMDWSDLLEVPGTLGYSTPNPLPPWDTALAWRLTLSEVLDLLQHQIIPYAIAVVF